MKVIQIPVVAIESTGRLRPVNWQAVEGLVRSIRRDGLRQPVEVVKLEGRMRWRLVAGAHRLAAVAEIGDAMIDAIEVDGDEAALRRLEVMDNLARNELTKLERCRFVAELKRIHQAANPTAKRGGDRRSGIAGEQSATGGTLAEWYGEVALRSDRAVRSIKREASIGERLTEDSFARLAGTEFDDNQRDLELLSKEGPERQEKILDALFRKTDPAGSVAEAIDELDGGAGRKDDEEEKALGRLVERWNRAPAYVRRSFIKAIPTDDLAQAMAERGYRVIRAEDAA
jgi:ParB family chromosome partitioning protein